MQKSIFILAILFASCTPQTWLEGNVPQQITNQNTVEQVVPMQQQDILYDEYGNMIVDFVPALQPFVNEGCNTAWNNLSAIVMPEGQVVYFISLPDYTADTTDLDKDRFTFIYQVQNPFYNVFPNENPYTMLQVNWYTLPIDDYGSLTCEGLQEIRTWVLDELTGRWYMNSQICWAALLCNGQTSCTDNGWNIGDVEYTPYQSGYIHLMETNITEQ
jgi:hypothetical protein